MAYTVPKLTDYSAAALDAAVSQLLAALREEAANAWVSESAWKAFRDRWLAGRTAF